MGGKKVVLPLLAIAVVLVVVVVGKMLVGGLSPSSNDQKLEKAESGKKPSDLAKGDEIGQEVSHAENSPLGRAEETKTVSDVLRAHVLPGVARVYRVLRYDEEALKEDLLSSFPDIADVRVDENIVYIKYKDGTVDIYESGFEDEPKEHREGS